MPLPSEPFMSHASRSRHVGRPLLEREVAGRSQFVLRMAPRVCSPPRRTDPERSALACLSATDYTRWNWGGRQTDLMTPCPVKVQCDETAMTGGKPFGASFISLAAGRNVQSLPRAAGYLLPDISLSAALQGVVLASPQTKPSSASWCTDGGASNLQGGGRTRQVRPDRQFHDTDICHTYPGKNPLIHLT